MDYARLVHPYKFDHTRQQFNDTTFKKSTSGGLSIIDVKCAVALSGSLCAHIDKYYKGVGGDPPVFYLMKALELPPGSQLTQSPSTGGDIHCHYDAGNNVSGTAMKRAFEKKLDWQMFYICDHGAHRALTSADVAAFPIKPPSATKNPTMPVTPTSSSKPP